VFISHYCCSNCKNAIFPEDSIFERWHRKLASLIVTLEEMSFKDDVNPSCMFIKDLEVISFVKKLQRTLIRSRGVQPVESLELLFDEYLLSLPRGYAVIMLWARSIGVSDLMIQCGSCCTMANEAGPMYISQATAAYVNGGYSVRTIRLSQASTPQWGGLV